MNMLTICIDELAHSDYNQYIEQNLSLVQLRNLTKFFFDWKGITSDELWYIYNSDNKEIITNIPLVKSFIKDCKNEQEIESLIRSLV